jgi:two-component system LytT family sensor kinase
MAKRGDKLFWTVFGASGLVALLTVIAIRLNPPTPPRIPAGGGPSLPRMRGPVGDVSTGDLLRGIGVGSLTWYASILSAPLFIWLSRRLPFDRRRWPVSLAAHLAVVAALVILTGLVQYRLSYAGFPGAPSVGQYLRVLLLTGALPFLTVAAAAHALEARLRARDRELDAARVKSQLAEARLEALNAQLQPHFLFNTLQAISTLVSRDPAAAERMIANLADLLREVLRRGDQREISLREELRVLEAYLEISRQRFGDRLTLTIDATPDTLDAGVPFFVLQPLVENALHHGVGSRSGAATVVISARRERGQLVLSVADDGPGAESPEVKRGIGLANTAARLAELYGSASVMTVGPRAEGGFLVRIAIPFRAAPIPATVPA